MVTGLLAWRTLSPLKDSSLRPWGSRPEESSAHSGSWVRRGWDCPCEGVASSQYLSHKTPLGVTSQVARAEARLSPSAVHGPSEVAGSRPVTSLSFLGLSGSVTELGAGRAKGEMPVSEPRLGWQAMGQRC